MPATTGEVSFRHCSVPRELIHIILISLCSAQLPRSYYFYIYSAGGFTGNDAESRILRW